MTLEERKTQTALDGPEAAEVRSTVLFETSHALLSPSGIEAALQTVAGTLEAWLPVNGVTLALLEEGEPRVLAMAGLEAEAVRSHFEAVVRPVFERVRQTGKAIPFHQDEAHRMCDDCDPIHGDPLCRFLGVPVKRRDELVGVLMAEDRDESPE